MAVIGGLRHSFPDVCFTGICSDPPDTEKTHGIPAFHLSGRKSTLVVGNGTKRRSFVVRLLRKFSRKYEEKIGWLLNIFSCCRSLDVLIISGSGQLDDFWGGPWKHPFSLFIWSLAARLCGTKVIVFGVGWDDLSTRIGKFFVFTVLRLAHYRAYRDSGTVQKLVADGVQLQSSICPDPAFGLDTPLPEFVNNDPPVIMVCPINSRAWLEEPDETYVLYLKTLTEYCVQLLQDGYVIRLASSQKHMDLPLAKEMAETLRNRSGKADRVQVFEAQSVTIFQELARSADLVIASRLHALILSAVAETPLVAIAFSRKVTQMMSDLGMESFCLSLPTLQAKELRSVVANALKKRNELHSELKETMTRYRSDLNNQYHTIQEMVSGELP